MAGVALCPIHSKGGVVMVGVSLCTTTPVWHTLDSNGYKLSCMAVYMPCISDPNAPEGGKWERNMPPPLHVSDFISADFVWHFLSTICVLKCYDYVVNVMCLL